MKHTPTTLCNRPFALESAAAHVRSHQKNTISKKHHHHAKKNNFDRIKVEALDVMKLSKGGIVVPKS
jgi:hypothetical protein